MAAPTPADIVRRHPHAARLHIADGRTRLGLVIDTRRPERGSPAAPSFAFGPDDRFVGEFPDRRKAAAALTARAPA